MKHEPFLICQKNHIFNTKLKVFSELISLLIISVMFFLTANLHASELGDELRNNKLVKRCLYVSSYHPGYEWQDGVEQGMAATLDGQCQLQRFYMDTKRNKNSEFARIKALEAKGLIDRWQPDVVITSDDNAARYLVMPYFKDSKVPFVFCGINWNADKYGFPFSNATGMVEVGPNIPLLKHVKAILKKPVRGFFLGGDVRSTVSNFERLKADAADNDILLDSRLVVSMDAWEAAFKEAQSQADFLVTANHAGIVDWDLQRAVRIIHQSSRILSVGYHEYMKQLNMLSLTKLAEEQGDWAAQVALEILAGASPADFPVVVNHRWNLYINPELLKLADIDLPESIFRKAIKLTP